MGNDQQTQPRGFVRLTDTTLTREIHGEMVLLDLREEVYFSLDEVGMAVLEATLEAANFDEAIAALRATFDVDERMLRTDVSALLAALQDAGLVVVTDGLTADT